MFINYVGIIIHVLFQSYSHLVHSLLKKQNLCRVQIPNFTRVSFLLPVNYRGHHIGPYIINPTVSLRWREMSRI